MAANSLRPDFEHITKVVRFVRPDVRPDVRPVFERVILDRLYGIIEIGIIMIAPSLARTASAMENIHPFSTDCDVGSAIDLQPARKPAANID